MPKRSKKTNRLTQREKFVNCLSGEVGGGGKDGGSGGDT